MLISCQCHVLSALRSVPLDYLSETAPEFGLEPSAPDLKYAPAWTIVRLSDHRKAKIK